jgi:hypothetical protein
MLVTTLSSSVGVERRARSRSLVVVVSAGALFDVSDTLSARSSCRNRGIRLADPGVMRDATDLHDLLVFVNPLYMRRLSYCNLNLCST